MKTFAVLAALLVASCTRAEVEAIDPTVYQDVYCPDQHGNSGPNFPWTRLRSDEFCCVDQGMGAGSCPEGTSCMLPDSCTATPLPPNDPGGFDARRVQRRAGL